MNSLELQVECFSQGGRLEKFTEEQDSIKNTSSFKRLLYLLNKEKLSHEIQSPPTIPKSSRKDK